MRTMARMHGVDAQRVNADGASAGIQDATLPQGVRPDCPAAGGPRTMGSSQGPGREAPILEVRPGLALWQGPGASAYLELDRHAMHVPREGRGAHHTARRARAPRRRLR
jgi:hypothetical protein